MGKLMNGTFNSRYLHQPNIGVKMILVAKGGKAACRAPAISNKL